jgi:hypothetical protein
MAYKMSPARRLQQAREFGIEVDPEDEWLLTALTWSVNSRGYVVANEYVKGKGSATVLLTHYIMGAPIWHGDVVDHIDRNKLNNRRSNLRLTNWSTNIKNSEYVERASYVYANVDCFEVRFTVNGRPFHVGTFGSYSEAKEARDQWLLEHAT